MILYRQVEGSNNCVQLCLASIFDVSPNEVPHVFRDWEKRGWTEKRWRELSRWANKQGREALFLSPNELEHQARIAKLDYSAQYYIGLFCVRDSHDHHAVVMCRGEVIHDPRENSGIYGHPLSYICFDWKEEKEWRPGCFSLVLGIGVLSVAISLLCTLWDQLTQ